MAHALQTVQWHEQPLMEADGQVRTFHDEREDREKEESTRQMNMIYFTFIANQSKKGD